MDDLKSYRGPWKGHLLLACKKCQRKIKKSGYDEDLAGLKKTVKHRNKQRQDDPLHVLNVPCMDLCPKDGVAVCFPRIAADRLFILRRAEDLETLCES